MTTFQLHWYGRQFDTKTNTNLYKYQGWRLVLAKYWFMSTGYDHDLSLCFVFSTSYDAACMFKDMENFPIIVSF
jgi:hypothetical protein